MDNCDPFASSEAEIQTPSITISDLSWPPIDDTTSSPNAPPATGEAGAFDWPDLSAPSPPSGKDLGNGLSSLYLLSENTLKFEKNLNVNTGNSFPISWTSGAQPNRIEPQPGWPGLYPDLDTAGGDNDNVADSAPDKPPRNLTTETSDTLDDIKDGAGVSHTEQSHSSNPGTVQKKVSSK